jgi:hypothetical protein
MKTRSSSGVGMKMDLEFNIETLRITDLPEDEQESSMGNNRGTSSIIEGIKRRTTVDNSTGEVTDDPAEGTSVGRVRATVQSTKLRDILNSMSDSDEV